ncbi:MAG: transglutaminase-like domain-containing protein [Oscillospiraceae bacterium]|nr:transglutaminase-like domain-containing protein [Oscillospiraceae bacterium]
MIKTKIRDSVLKNIIPLSLCIAIIVICMYNYGKQYIALYFAIAAVFQTAVFIFFDYLSTKSVLLRFVSILGSFFAMCAMVFLSVKLGYNTNSIEFFVWFLSPQALVDFSASYIVAIFIIMNFFISSTVYYFSIVRYRISMTFLITLIPFAFYRKEGEKIPVVFAMILLVLYVALMIHCRHSFRPQHQKVIINNGYRTSLLVFLAFTVMIAIICPKPQFQAANNFVNTLLDSEKFSDYMLKQLGIVSDTSYVTDMFTSPTNKELFSFVVEETPINLKSQTYSIYNYDKNVWKTQDDDVHGTLFNTDKFTYNDQQLFYEAVALAAQDSDFADKYDLHDLKPELNGEYKRKLTLINSVISTKYCLVPTTVYDVGINAGLYIAPNGMVFKDAQSASDYSVRYYSSQILYEADYVKVLEKLNNENFLDFTADVYSNLEQQSDDIFQKYKYSILKFYTESSSAYTYLDDIQDDLPQSISDIAHSITDKYDSVYEKANALEAYFARNDFKYDLSYKRPSDYNMEYFLTEGKTGICTDYATAMVILARSIGIPARYTEGVAILEADPDTNIAHVTDADLHAFPELYIPGFGWKSFEPTQVEEAGNSMHYNYVLTLTIIISTLVIIGLCFVFIKFIYPGLYVMILEFRVMHADARKAAGMIMKETGKCINAHDSMTSEEISAQVLRKYSFDISKIAQTFESAVYGDCAVSDNDLTESMKVYVDLRNTIKQTEKAQKAEKRNNRKRVKR